MLCLGIDPDMHDLAIASWDDLGPVSAHVVSVPKKLTGTDALLAMMHELSKPWPEFARSPALISERQSWIDEFGMRQTEEAQFEEWELPSWCAVEGQESRAVRGRHHARPLDLIHLGNVAGMAAMRVARGYLHGCGLYWPKPSEWKGQVEKHAMQARLYEELGWGYEIVWKKRGGGMKGQGGPKKGDYALPGEGYDEQLGSVSTAQWKHVGDALLLARWCWEQASGRVWSR
jgi:hypothetical protein